MPLQDLKIATRLALGFAVMGCLVAGIGAVALLNVRGIEREFQGVMTDAYPKIVLATAVKGVNGEVGQALRNLLIMTDPEDLKVQFDAIAASSKKANEHFEALGKTITDPAGQALFEKLEAARKAYGPPRDKVIDLVHKDSVEEAKIIMVNQLRPKQAAYMARLDELIALQEARMAEAAQQVKAAVATTQAAVAAMVVGSFVVGAVLALWLVRSITRPLHEALKAARAVADGDLASEVESGGNNETGLMLKAMRDMKVRLAGIVGDVRRNAEGVATASSQIAHGNQDLSIRTERQAAALQQTAASMEELGSTVRQNADNAQQGNQLALQASSVAVRGGEVVGQVVETMKGINDASKRIADITGVIDGIAFQTNILALNAAVEAARAGEQGRGFAVVASEVRSLAQRSAEAAKEIKSLIGTSVERVDRGSVLVDQAGATMQEVVAAIRRVTDIMGEISAASTEQNSGVAQVGQAVTEMDQATQQNAALVEQSAAAAESLRTQAQQLVDAVSVFRLGASAHAGLVQA